MPKIVVINLESGMPRVQEALDRLDREIAVARRDGARAAKIIHGYGSSGVGGAIKRAVHSRLAQLKRQGKIKEFVAGENWDVFDEATRRVLEVCGELGPDPDLRYQNEGISILLF